MSSKAAVFVPDMALDRRSGVPMQEQIYQAVVRAVQSGGAFRNARLPASRVLAKLLGVSRNTVLKAYADLQADGFIEGRHGSGMRVIQNTAPHAPTWFGLRQAIQASGFPARVVGLEDCDGNAMYIRF